MKINEIERIEYTEINKLVVNGIYFRELDFPRSEKCISWYKSVSFDLLSVDKILYFEVLSLPYAINWELINLQEHILSDNGENCEPNDIKIFELGKALANELNSVIFNKLSGREYESEIWRGIRTAYEEG